MPYISAIKGYPSLLISNIFFCTSLSLFGGTLLCPPKFKASIYKHRSAMDLPTEAACLSGVVSSFGAGLSPLTLYIRGQVLRSLESPLPLCIYRIAYFPLKNNRQDIRIPVFGFVLKYKLYIFVLYVLTDQFAVCYNNTVAENPTEQYRRTFFCVQGISYLFLRKARVSSQKGYKNKKTVERVTNIWYNIIAYPVKPVKHKSNTRKEITENDQKRNR